MTADRRISGEELRLRGDYAEAERHLREAVAMMESTEPPNPQSLAIALNGLGLVFKDLARYDDARHVYRRALGLLESIPETRDDWIATVYHNLGGIEHASGNYAEAESFARKGLAIRNGASADAELVAKDMVALAAILDAQEKHDEAESLYRGGLETFERATRPDSGEIAVALHGLGTLCASRGRLADAESYLTRAAAIKTERLGSRHADLAVTLNNLALVYRRRGELPRAAATYQRAWEILTLALGARHPKTIVCRENYLRCANQPAPR